MRGGGCNNKFLCCRHGGCSSLAYVIYQLCWISRKCDDHKKNVINIKQGGLCTKKGV